MIIQLILLVFINIAFGIYLNNLYKIFDIKLNLHTFTNLFFCVFIAFLVDLFTMYSLKLNIIMSIFTGFIVWYVNSIPVEGLKDEEFGDKLRSTITFGLMWPQFYSFLLFGYLNKKLIINDDMEY